MAMDDGFHYAELQKQVLACPVQIASSCCQAGPTLLPYALGCYTETWLKAAKAHKHSNRCCTTLLQPLVPSLHTRS